MKRLNGLLLSGVLMTSVLTGCGSQVAPILTDNITAPAQNVTTQSLEGLKDYYKFFIKKTFDKLDSNKDGFINKSEFGATSDPTQAKVFTQLDLDKDGKISLKELRDKRNFLLAERNLRSMVNKSFNGVDTDKNKLISKPEFFTYMQVPVTNPPLSAVIVFNVSDKNLDGNLTFSEYEDYIYEGLKASDSTPGSQPANPVPPSSAPVQPPSDPAGPAPVPADPAGPAPVQSAQP
jgi:Ca2+-binding EF-hand superfamily protein